MAEGPYPDVDPLVLLPPGTVFTVAAPRVIGTQLGLTGAPYPGIDVSGYSDVDLFLIATAAAAGITGVQVIPYWSELGTPAALTQFQQLILGAPTAGVVTVSPAQWNRVASSTVPARYHLGRIPAAGRRMVYGVTLTGAGSLTCAIEAMRRA